MKTPPEIRLALLSLTLSLARAYGLDLKDLLPAYASPKNDRNSEAKLKLTTSEAAELLRCSPKTLQNWRYAGTGPKSTMVGGRHVYDRNVLEAYQRSRTVADDVGSTGPKRRKRRRR